MEPNGRATLTQLSSLRTALAPIRSQVREAIPFPWRMALRRAPAVSAWALRPLLEETPVLSVPQRTLPASTRSTERFTHVQAERRSPLRRPGTSYNPTLQDAKERNVQQGANRLHGSILEPSDVFSWHQRLGPPLRMRGFANGPELHNDTIASGPGGGLCQVANLVFWLAMKSGMTLLERHRHSLDLFPDAARSVPFGCGATVFYPHKDLRFRNPLPQPMRLELQLNGDSLSGRMRFPQATGFRCELVEVYHRFYDAGGTRWRENKIERWTYRGQRDTPQREPLLTNRARVCY